MPWTVSPDVHLFEAMAKEGETGLLVRRVSDLLQHTMTVRMEMLTATVIPLLQPDARNRGEDAKAWAPVWDAWDRLGLTTQTNNPDLGVCNAVGFLAWLSRPDLVEVLLAHGCDPNSSGPRLKDGVRPLTPLHLAAGVDNPAFVAMLLARGADPTLRAGQRQETALQHAQRLGKTLVLPVLDSLELRSTLHDVGSDEVDAPAPSRARL